MNTRIFLLACLLAAAGLVAAWPLTASAQDSASWAPFRDVHLRDGCRFARQVLTTGQPAVKRPEALAFIPRCGPVAGETVAEVLGQSRAIATQDRELDDLITAVWGLRDSRLLAAGLDVAQDRGASTVARIEALRLVLAQIDPAQPVGYAELARGSAGEGTNITDWPVREGTPLPAGYLGEIANAMDRITADSSTPAIIGCVASQIGFVARKRNTSP